MTIKVFGELTDFIDENDSRLTSAVRTHELRKILGALYPQLTNKTYRIAVNRMLTEDDVALAATDEIAIMPPFSGG